MAAALYLLFALGLIGAFDTFYYHEWMARLPARGVLAKAELTLHAVRDFLYAIIFCTLPTLSWQGSWCIALIAVLCAEIVFTMWDFIVEAVERKPIGDVFAGERVTHAIMGIIYGAMISLSIPTLIHWLRLPTRIVLHQPVVPQWVAFSLVTMGVGVFLSGVRDLYASFGLPHGSWPWRQIEANSSSDTTQTAPTR